MIFTEGLKAIRDTLIIAGIAMPLGGLYGVLVGYLVTRGSFPGRRTMEITSMIDYALPGTIVGIAYLIAFNEPPIQITGTALIIIACYIFRYGPTGIRTTVALLQQIDRSLEEASRGLGAGSGTTLFIWPPIGPPAREPARRSPALSAWGRLLAALDVPEPHAEAVALARGPVQTLRNRLIKLVTEVTETADRIRIALAPVFPIKEILTVVSARLARFIT